MTEENKAGLSRRTVLKGAAWSVPVVAAAVAVPMAAASHEGHNLGNLLVSSSDISSINATFGSFELTPQNVFHEAIPDVVTTVTLTYSGPAEDFNFLSATVFAPWVVAEQTANIFTVVSPPRQVNNGGYAVDSLSIYFGGQSASTLHSITATASTFSESTGFYNSGLAINPYEGTGSVTGPTSL